MDKKDVIINGLIVVVVLLGCIFVGYKMGNQQGMISVCEDMGGRLGLDSRTNEVKCLNSSFFEPIEQELNLDLGGFNYES